MSVSGKCLCGAVRIEVDGTPADISACHCSLCRRWAGAAFWGFPTRAEAVTVSGEVARYRSSSFAERVWCPACGTHLWFRDDGGEYELVPGLFDAADDTPLAREVYADHAPTYVTLQGDHVRVTAADYERDHPFVEDVR